MNVYCDIRSSWVTSADVELSSAVSYRCEDGSITDTSVSQPSTQGLTLTPPYLSIANTSQTGSHTSIPPMPCELTITCCATHVLIEAVDVICAARHAELFTLDTCEYVKTCGGERVEDVIECDRAVCMIQCMCEPAVSGCKLRLVSLFNADSLWLHSIHITLSRSVISTLAYRPHPLTSSLTGGPVFDMERVREILTESGVTVPSNALPLFNAMKLKAQERQEQQALLNSLLPQSSSVNKSVSSVSQSISSVNQSISSVIPMQGSAHQASHNAANPLDVLDSPSTLDHKTANPLDMLHALSTLDHNSSSTLISNVLDLFNNLRKQSQAENNKALGCSVGVSELSSSATLASHPVTAAAAGTNASIATNASTSTYQHADNGSDEADTLNAHVHTNNKALIDSDAKVAISSQSSADYRLRAESNIISVGGHHGLDPLAVLSEVEQRFMERLERLEERMVETIRESETRVNARLDLLSHQVAGLQTRNS